ncbi:uncharacterized protein PG986_005098 [Apiospora aurea]|uniref:Rhodopsin domain-containing protein n=1 Tax=Apiospora aurea TaxID=335848 RepID=A0ABR1QGK0_9PEZI
MATPVAPTSTASETRIPAMPPPPGATSNFDHPDTLVLANYIAMGIALPFITIPFLLRCYVRPWRKRTWIFEDSPYLAGATVLSSHPILTPLINRQIGTVSLCGTGASAMAHYGGRHTWDVTEPQAQQAAYQHRIRDPRLTLCGGGSQWFNVVSIHYGVTICFVKLTILWLYRRLFSPARRGPFDVGIVSLVAFLVGFYVATNVAKVWQCIPREKIWVTSLPRELHQHLDPAQRERHRQYRDRRCYLAAPHKGGLELESGGAEEDYARAGLHVWSELGGDDGPLEWHGQPRQTWVHPEIILWGLAELTTGVLCFSVPELGLLLRKKPKPGPSDSILQGRYLKEDSAYLNKRSSNKSDSGSSNPDFPGLSTIVSSHHIVAVKSRSRSRDLGNTASWGTVTGGDSSYYELDERKWSDTTISFAQHGDGDGRCPTARSGQNGVIVTRDFRVETSRA